MESSSKISCCEAINNAIGTFYYEQSIISDAGAALVDANFPDPAEAVPRGQQIFGFLQALNIAILAKFATFRGCGKNTCCESGAHAVQQIGLAYSKNIFTAIAYKTFPLAALPALVAGLTTGYTNALAAITIDSGCCCHERNDSSERRSRKHNNRV